MEWKQPDIRPKAKGKLPVCLCLDVSGTMEGEPIQELSQGVQRFLEEVNSDPDARECAEIAIVTFGGSVQKVVDFAPAAEIKAPAFIAQGLTPMGAAVTLALDILVQRKESHREAGTEYFQPWLVLMTDGEPTDSWEDAARRSSQLIQAGSLVLIPVGLGPGANLEALRPFSPQLPPLRMQDHKFNEFFRWLPQSIGNRSRTPTGQGAPLHPDIMSWAAAMTR
jgi:uncharacterized protein YegL